MDHSQFIRGVATVAIGCLLATGGCGYLRQMTSPNLRALAPYGAATIPDRDDAIYFNTWPLTDENLAESFRYIAEYAPRLPSFEGREITDLSVSLLLQLDSVEELRIERTGISAAGIARLTKMHGLKDIYISSNQITREQLAGLEAVQTRVRFHMEMP